MTTGTVVGYTKNYRLAKIAANARGYADEEHSNLTIMDTVLFALGGISGILGEWLNATAYLVGDRVIDTDGKVYQCAIANTSAASGTFTNDRTANPTFWTLILNAPVSRGTWATGIVYNANDFVFDGVGDRYAVCNTTHTSTTTFATDIAFWDILIDFNKFTNDLTVQKSNPAFILDDTDESAGDDFAQFILQGAVAAVQGTANGKLIFEGFGTNVNLDQLDVRWGGSLEKIWHAGNDGAASGLDADLLDAVQGAAYAREISEQSVWIPAASLTPALTNGGILAATEELSTDNVMIHGMDFDASTRQNAQFSFQAPKGADESAALILQGEWTDGDTAGTLSVKWGFEALAVAADESLNGTYGTAVVAADSTFTATKDRHVSAEVSITPGGTWAAGDWITVQIFRDIADDYTQKARLTGIHMRYSTTTLTDA